MMLLAPLQWPRLDGLAPQFHHDTSHATAMFKALTATLAYNARLTRLSNIVYKTIYHRHYMGGIF